MYKYQMSIGLTKVLTFYLFSCIYQNFLKLERLYHQCFPLTFSTFSEQLFQKTPGDSCFCIASLLLIIIIMLSWSTKSLCLICSTLNQNFKTYLVTKSSVGYFGKCKMIQDLVANVICWYTLSKALFLIKNRSKIIQWNPTNECKGFFHFQSIWSELQKE